MTDESKQAKLAKKPRIQSSIEESALATEALLRATDGRISPDGLVFSGDDPPRAVQHAIARGLAFLVDAIEENRHREPSPIGFYFAKLWYYEKLYPLTFTASALGQAVGPFASPTERKVEHAHR